MVCGAFCIAGLMDGTSFAGSSTVGYIKPRDLLFSRFKDIFLTAKQALQREGSSPTRIAIAVRFEGPGTR